MTFPDLRGRIATSVLSLPDIYWAGTMLGCRIQMWGISSLPERMHTAWYPWLLAWRGHRMNVCSGGTGLRERGRAWWRGGQGRESCQAVTCQKQMYGGGNGQGHLGREWGCVPSIWPVIFMHAINSGLSLKTWTFRTYVQNFALTWLSLFFRVPV